MFAYYLIYTIPAIAAMLYADKTVRSNPFVWGFVGIFFTFFLGYRVVGGDWWNYHARFDQMAYLTLEDSFAIKDPGYQLISFYFYHWDIGFFGVTLLCAAISMTGLIVFLRRQVNPWLGLAVAVPYLIIVVYMGYMRQGVALGLIMWSITFLERGKFLRSFGLVMLAVTFHKSAVLMANPTVYCRNCILIPRYCP